MNKSKFFKILAPIVALGLLIGALVGITAQAGTEGPEIMSMNVEYSSELYLYYAVPKASFEGAPALEIVADKDASSVVATITEYTEATVHGTDCYVFKTNGIAAADLNKSEFVRAADGENKGSVVEYSVETYLYTRLYKNGVAAATEGKALAQRNLYFQLLKYGLSAQNVFDQEAADKIGGPGVMVAGQPAISGAYSFGEFLALNSVAVEGKTFSYWQVDEIDAFGNSTNVQKLLGDGYEYVVSTGAVITPVYDAESTEGVLAWDPYVLHFNEMPATSAYTIGSGSPSEKDLVIGTNTWNIVTLEDGNNVLKIDKDCGGKKIDGSAKSYNWGVNNSAFTTLKESGATVAVFEAKFLLADLYGNAGIQMTLYGGSTTGSNAPVRLWLTTSNYSKGQEFRYNDYYNNAPLKEGETNYWKKMGAYNGEWFTLRVEYRNTFDEAGNINGIEYKTFVDGNLVATSNRIYGTSIVAGTYAIPKVSEITKMGFNFNNDYLGDFYLDDVSLKLIAE